MSPVIDLETQDNHLMKNDPMTRRIYWIGASCGAFAWHHLWTHINVSNFHTGLRPNYWGKWHGNSPSQWLVTGMSPGANVLLGTTVDKDSDLGQTPERPML